MGSCRKLSANFYSTKIRVAKQRTEACGEGERKGSMPPWSCSTPTCNTKLNHGRCAFFFSFPSVFLAIRPKRTAMVPRDQNLPKMIREPAKSSTYCLLSVLLLLSQESDCGCERLQLQPSGHHITVASILPRILVWSYLFFSSFLGLEWYRESIFVKHSLVNKR